MATGGVFTMITNDGKQDKLLMATGFLHARLRAINQFKTASNGGCASNLDNLPTLRDIEKTHILFTNAHFKPFATIGFEYNKVKASTGNPTLGQEIQFSIPQFGDFFHDMCVHVVLQQPTLTSTATNNSDAPAMRWCHFPGERLLKRVQQEVNNNPLDEYTYHSTTLYREFKVAPNKLTGWYRNVGQEEPEEGWVRQPDWANSGVVSDSHRVKALVSTGNQTPTPQKDTTSAGDLEMFIPLLFWYNRDVRLSVPSVAIPYGQRFINIELSNLNELVSVTPRGAGTWASPNGSLSEPTPTLKSIELYINNIFLTPQVHKIYIRRIGFSLIRVHRQQTINATKSSDEVLLQQLKWPIEYLFIGMKLKDYHASTSAATMAEHLDKWHLFHKVDSKTYKTTGQNALQESEVFDITTNPGGKIGISALGVITNTSGNAITALTAVNVNDVLKIGGSYYTVTVGVAAGNNVTGITVSPAPAVAITDTTALAASVRRVVSQGVEYQTYRPVATLNSLTLKAHGIPLYNNFPLGFYNSYLPFHFGGRNINTPKDAGVAFITFCLFPGTYQPSGHFNISRAREFYLEWDSSVIDSSTNGTLVVVASAINFLLISDGSAILRYST